MDVKYLESIGRTLEEFQALPFAGRIPTAEEDRLLEEYRGHVELFFRPGERSIYDSLRKALPEDKKGLVAEYSNIRDGEQTGATETTFFAGQVHGFQLGMKFMASALMTPELLNMTDEQKVAALTTKLLTDKEYCANYISALMQSQG